MKPFPNSDLWQPIKKTSENLKDIFHKRCLSVEARIKNRVDQEKQFNINNFDSGMAVEDIIRDELSEILPKRYFVTRGLINDRNGFTAGDMDLIIFNNIWFPYLKTGATAESRRFHFPIEGVYAVGEIKQTLTIDNLDEAIEKLVIAKRLERPKTGGTRIVENRELNDSVSQSTNPLYTFIIATDLDERDNLDEFFVRFFEINKTLKRKEIVNCLCILQKATITWAYLDGKRKELQPASFEINSISSKNPIIPVLLSVDEKRKSSFYDFTTLLLANLYNSILGGEDISLAYGNNYADIKVPPQDKFTINPQ